MSTLAIIDKWDPIFHGYMNGDIKHIKTLKSLDFIHELGSYHFQIKYFNPIKFIKNLRNGKNECFMEFSQYRDLKLKLVRGIYTYKSRMFAIPNKSFDIFLIKLKKRYRNKINKKKNVKNLFNRQIYGKFIHK